MAIRNILGGPGVSNENVWSHKYVFRSGGFEKLRNGGWVDATRSRDAFAAAAASLAAAGEVLSPGLMMGQVGNTATFAPSFFGATTAAVAKGATTVNVGVQHAVEINRRVGSTGSLFIVGPPAANGLAQVGSLTYSAVNTATGALTVSATGGNEVQTVNIAGTVTGGTFRLLFPQADGSYITTGTIAHNATFATVISNAQTALDAIFGAGVVVASGTAYTGIVLTSTLTTQASRNVVGLVVADISALTGATTATTTETTVGSYGTFIAGSLVGAADGTFFPKTMIHPGYGLQVADGSTNVIGNVIQWATVPIGGDPEFSQLTPYVTDLGIRRWIADQISGLAPSNVGVSGSISVGGKWFFPDWMNAVL